MALPIDSRSAARAYDMILGNRDNLKREIPSMISTLAGGDVGYDMLRKIYSYIENSKNQLADLRATTGIAAYAKNQVDDPTYEIKANITLVTSAISVCLTTIRQLTPTTASILPANEWGDESKSLVNEFFTPANTAQLRTDLQAVITAITG
jgi:hypothetical protein